MDSNKSISSLNEKSIESKLRRLKIQESILSQDLQKTEQKVLLDSPNNPISDLNSVPIDSNKSDKPLKIKDSYSYVKNLFGDVYSLTQSRELLAEIDINEMKEKVLEFETKLKSLKTTINLELKALKTSEQELIEQLNEEPKEMNKLNRQRKLPSAKFNDIVPSPVRALMTSPLKCMEVQEYQNFMAASGNRYGGWNEYNHNIFVKFWQKKFASNYDCGIVNEDFEVTEEHETFILDLLPKLQGVTGNDIKSHMKWYIKHLFLKGKQQKAIEKWRSNRRSIKCDNNEALEDNDVLLRDQQILSKKDKEPNGLKRLKSKTLSSDRNVSSNSEKRDSTFMKPTTQWLYRTYDEDVGQGSGMNDSVDNIQKLCIPKWRLNLIA